VHRAANLFFKVRKEIDALEDAGSGPECGAAAANDPADETKPMAVAPPVDGWSGFTESVGDETNPTAAVVAPIGAVDETKPTAAAAPPESRLQAAGRIRIPAEAGTPTGPLVESRLQAECAISSADETKPSPGGSRSATASDNEDPRNEAAVDPKSANPRRVGPRPPGGAEPSGADPTPPLPAIVIEALRSLAQRQAAAGISVPRLDDLIRRAEERVPAIERASEPESPRPPSRTVVGSTVQST
jgi:hypothetical protein